MVDHILASIQKDVINDSPFQTDAWKSLCQQHEIFVASFFSVLVPWDIFTTLFADNSIVDVLKIFTL